MTFKKLVNLIDDANKLDIPDEIKYAGAYPRKEQKMDGGHDLVFRHKETEERHRENGPAVIEDNKESWYFNGKLHRDDGPAIVDADGNTAYFKDGKLHNEDGPAINTENVSAYYIAGELHNDNGPALITTKGHVYYVNGKKVDSE